VLLRFAAVPRSVPIPLLRTSKAAPGAQRVPGAALGPGSRWPVHETPGTRPTARRCGSGGGYDVVGWASRGGVQAVQDAQRGARLERQSGDLRGRTEGGQPGRGVDRRPADGRLPDWRSREPRVGSLAGHNGHTAIRPPRTRATTAPPRSGTWQPDRVSPCSTALAAAMETQAELEHPPAARRSGQRAHHGFARGAHAAAGPRLQAARRTQAG
jgi:hypothetical protein